MTISFLVTLPWLWSLFTTGRDVPVSCRKPRLMREICVQSPTTGATGPVQIHLCSSYKIKKWVKMGIWQQDRVCSRPPRGIVRGCGWMEIFVLFVWDRTKVFLLFDWWISVAMVLPSCSTCPLDSCSVCVEESILFPRVSTIICYGLVRIYVAGFVPDCL